MNMLRQINSNGLNFMKLTRQCGKLNDLNLSSSVFN